MRTVRRAALLALVTAALGAVVVRAQAPDEAPSSDLALDALDACALSARSPEPGRAAAEDELRAYCEAATEHRYIDARERAETILRARPDSAIAHFVLGYVHHYGEGNFPRALFHLERALELYVRQWGSHPTPDLPWRWHADLLRELAFTEGDLEHYESQLRWLAAYDALYSPQLVGERAWPLMKLRRFDEARAVAEAARRSGDTWQTELALNALCAIEFEAGDERRSYPACRDALMLHGGDPTTQSAVDFTNFAEAARSVFRLEEAEEMSLDATRARLTWYGNPYVDLAELYVREARFPEALDMLREVHGYRRRRPPHVQDADLNEARRALAEFYVVVGRGADALEITSRAVLSPDRRGHNSRDPAQDLALTALLDRAARRMEADRLEAEAVGAPFLERLDRWASAAWLRFGAWESGRQAARALADDARLSGIVQIGRARSAVMPPWLVGELADVVGPGVLAESLRRARAEDVRVEAVPYYDAFEAEAALAAGDTARAYALARQALGALGPSEALLRARTSAVSAEAARREGRRSDALAGYDEAFQLDPGVFVRMGLDVPVRIVSRGGAVADEAADLLAWSPRFTVEDVGLTVEVTADAAQGEVCLSSERGGVLGCGRAEALAADDAPPLPLLLARAFVAAAFAPQISLSAADVGSLDGSNAVSRDASRDLFGPGGLSE